MDNTKIYNMLLKLNSDILENFNKLENKMEIFDKQISKTESVVLELRNDVVRLEKNLNEKVNVLFDGYKQNYDFYDHLEKQLRYASRLVDNHDIKIQVVESQLRQAIS